MTWRKTGTEFDTECADVGLSDAAYRTHQEVIGYIYDAMRLDCRIPKRNVRRVVMSDNASSAIPELINHGWWADDGDYYEVLHHADVIRASITAQGARKKSNKEAQQRHRDRLKNDTSGTTNVSADVSDDTDRQTDSLETTTPKSIDCKHWAATTKGCSTCDKERATA